MSASVIAPVKAWQHFTIIFILIIFPTLEFLLSGFSFFYSHDWVGERFFLWLGTFVLFAYVVWVTTFAVLNACTKLLVGQGVDLHLAAGMLLLSIALILLRYEVWLLPLVAASGYLFFRNGGFSDQSVKRLFKSSFVFSMVAMAYLLLEMKDVYRVASVDQTAEKWDAKAKNIFLVIYDEFPTYYFETGTDGNLHPSLLPNISAFASEATYFAEAKSVSTNTIRAVPSILTGLPPVSVPPTAANHPVSLFTELAGAYDIVGYEPYTRICPSNLCDRPEPPAHFYPNHGKTLSAVFFRAMLVGALDTLIVAANAVIPSELVPGFIPSMYGRWTNFTNTNMSLLSGDDFQPWAKLAVDQRVDQHAFTQNLAKKDSPTLWFLHWNPPHAHEYYPDGNVYIRSNKYLLDNMTSTSVEVARVQQLWMQFRYMDDEFGKFIAKIKELELYDDALIILTSDHGMSLVGDRRGQDFRGGESEGGEYEAWLKTLYIPLIIKFPGQQIGQIRSFPASLLDIMPTILSQAGAPSAASLQLTGIDLETVSSSSTPTPTHWDLLSDTAENLEVKIKKPPPFLSRGRWGKNMAPDDSITFDVLLIEHSPYSGNYGNLPNKKFTHLGALSLKIQPQENQSYSFIEGLLEIEEEYANEPVILILGEKYCGFLGAIRHEGRSILEGLIDNTCISPELSELRAFTKYSEDLLELRMRSLSW